jgi:RimJ/RimL family protein N-acetyltransferase
MTVLETERLILRHFSTHDAPFILALLNEPSFLRYIGDKKVRSLEDARQYILEGPVATYERHGFGLYQVELKDLHTPIGMCGLLKRDDLPQPDIGFAFLPAFWNSGFAFEAATAVLTDARKRLKFDRILAIVNPDNDASIRLLQKLGFGFERIKRDVNLYAFPDQLVE